MTSILIADDFEVLRKALRNLLELEPGMVVIGEAGNGNAAVALALDLHPDIVLADINMPEPSGIEIAAILRVSLPYTHVLIVSSYEDIALIRSAFAAGATAYISKRMLDSRLVSAIHDTIGGQTGIVAIAPH